MNLAKFKEIVPALLILLVLALILVRDKHLPDGVVTIRNFFYDALTFVLLIALILCALCLPIIVVAVLFWWVQDFKKDFIKWRGEGSRSKLKTVPIQILKVLVFPVVSYLLVMCVFSVADFTLWMTYEFFGISATPPDINYFWNFFNYVLETKLG